MTPSTEITAKCVSQAIARIDLTGVGAAAGIIDATALPARANVLSTEIPYTRDARQRFAGFQRPSLIFSCSKTHSPIEAGDNQKAVVFYTIIAQILDTEFDLLGNTDKAAAREKWDFNIRRYFHTGNLRNEVFNTTYGMVTLIMVGDSDQMDEKLMQARDDGVITIPIIFKCWEPHDTTGRV